jgi:MraZ protein
VLFTGEYEHAIDSKQRLAIPAEHRDQLEAASDAVAMFLVPGPNGLLWLWPESVFRQMVGRMKSTLLPPTERMAYEQLFFSQSRRLELDSAGRIRIPERMIGRAGLGSGRVTILGVNDHLELVDSGIWQMRLEELLSRQAEMALRARAALESGAGSSGSSGSSGGSVDT